MRRFVEEQIRKAGLSAVLEARTSGDLATVGATIASWGKADLLALGAVADAVRVDDVGDIVHIHERASRRAEVDAMGITWVDPPAGVSELDFLRAVAVARISARKGARIGVDWSQRGMELAQVALGFGASDLCGTIMRKSGLPILDDEKLKVKGQGMVELRAIKKREIAALVTHAGRLPAFVDDETPRARESAKEVASV
jgi:hypothetical protein